MTVQQLDLISQSKFQGLNPIFDLLSLKSIKFDECKVTTVEPKDICGNCALS